MSSPTRWAGVPLNDRRAERRQLLVAAGFALFGEGGETAVTVRSVCRESGLNSRYFYESFASSDELLGAVYDHTLCQLGEAVADALEIAGEHRSDRVPAGIRAVLSFSSEDPRRGRVLFTDARHHPVLAEKLSGTKDLLFRLVVDEDERFHPDADPVSGRVAAALFTGAMTELVLQWLTGRLGDDLDAVVEDAAQRVLS